MQLTTIFTGHALDLMDIVAIGPHYREQGVKYLPPEHSKGDPYLGQTIETPVTQLQIDIHLHSTTAIKHVFFWERTAFMNPVKWDEKIKELEELRQKLIEQCEKIKFDNTIMVTSEIKPDYGITHKADSFEELNKNRIGFQSPAVIAKDPIPPIIREFWNE